MNKKTDRGKIEVEKNEGGILKFFWNSIIADTRLANELPRLVNNYKRNGGGRSKATIQSYFNMGSITWKVFIFLIFEILPVRKFKMTIELEYTDDTVEAYSLDVHPLADNKNKKGKENVKSTRYLK